MVYTVPKACPELVEGFERLYKVFFSRKTFGTFYVQ
jgi:hypothetical protein